MRKSEVMKALTKIQQKMEMIMDDLRNAREDMWKLEYQLSDSFKDDENEKSN